MKVKKSHSYAGLPRHLRTPPDGSASRQPPRITAGDLLTLSNAGDSQAIVTLMTVGTSGIGTMSASGSTEVVFNAADIGLPNGGSVTLSITGSNIAYEETAEADADGNIRFTVPFFATGAAVTVKLTVANRYGRVIWLGSRPMTLTEKTCDIAVTMTSTTPENFVYVEGNETIQDFYACMHEVTQGEYEQYCGYGGSTPTAQDKGVGSDYPAYSVNWYDAILYCNIRSKMEGLTPCYSLPGGQLLLATSSGVRSGSDGKPCGPNSDNPDWDAVVIDTSADGRVQ